MKRLIQIVLCSVGVLACAGGAMAVEPLQARIDALAAAGGGTLTLTAGVYRTGALFFKPGVNLHLARGARIVGKDEAAAYPMRETRIEGETCVYFPALINADRCDGFRISGEGVIDGHGLPTWKAFWATRKANPNCLNKDPSLVRPRVLYVSNSKNVDVSGVTFRDSKFWTTHYYRCTDVQVHDCTIISAILDGVRGPSTDAIDIDACRNVTIRRVTMDVNDDAVVIKGGKGLKADDYTANPGNGPSENVLIEDCTFNSVCLACLTLGSECPAASNIVMRNCRINGAGTLLYLKMRTDTPQHFSDVRVENCHGSCNVFLMCRPWRQFERLAGQTFPPSCMDGLTMRGNRITCKTSFDRAVDSSWMRLSRLDLADNVITLPPVLKYEIVADRFDCHYAAGETATLTVKVSDTNGIALSAGRIQVKTDNFGARELKPKAEIDLAKGNPFTVSATRATPGFIRWTFSAADGKPKVFGVGFDTEKIRPGTENPADFDQFWRDAIARYDRELPDARPEVRLDEKLSSEKWDVFRISIDALGGRKVHGFVTKPRGAKGRLPAQVSVAGAGYGTWSQGPDFSDGAISLKLTVYPFEPDPTLGARDKYKALHQDYKARYGTGGCYTGGIGSSREEYFYYPIILANNRIIDWFAHRADVQPSTLAYFGTSQGGGLGLAAMALNRNFVRGAVQVPALTDLTSSSVEDRQDGWPRALEAQRPENRETARKGLPYFCGCNFARRISIPIRFLVGFIDETCAPHAVYAAYNVCPSADKAILDGIGMGHGGFGDYWDYLRAWESAAQLKPSQYRFLAFNIWGDYFGNPCHERDLGEAEIVKRWNPDIAGFQEASPNFWKSRLFPELEKAGYQIVGRALGFKGGDTHDPIAFKKDRFTLIDAGEVHYCPELDVSKACLWVVLEDRRTHQRLATFASHFWWQYKGPGDDWIRLNNAQKLSAKMFELKEKYQAAIVGGGDLNSPMSSSGMKHLIAAGLADAQSSARIAPRGFPSEHGDPRRGPDRAYSGVTACRGINLVKPKFQYLDHIFYDPTRVEAQRFDLDISREACAVSDHHPIILDFNLKGSDK